MPDGPLQGCENIVGRGQFLAINSQDKVAVARFVARFVQGCFYKWIPGLPCVHPRNAIAAILNGQIGAEQADLDLFRLVNITAAGAVVTHLQFGDHFHHQRVEILAPPDMLYQRAVLVVHGLPVEAMHVIGVEIFLLHTPGLVKYLYPFLARIHQHLHATELEGFGFHLIADFSRGQ